MSPSHLHWILLLRTAIGAADIDFSPSPADEAAALLDGAGRAESVVASDKELRVSPAPVVLRSTLPRAPRPTPALQDPGDAESVFARVADVIGGTAPRPATTTAPMTSATTVTTSTTPTVLRPGKMRSSATTEAATGSAPSQATENLSGWEHNLVEESIAGTRFAPGQAAQASSRREDKPVEDAFRTAGGNSITTSERPPDAVEVSTDTMEDARGCPSEEYFGLLRISCVSKALRPDASSIWATNRSGILSVDLDAAYAMPVLANGNGGVMRRFTAQLERLPSLSTVSMDLKHSDLGEIQARELLVGLGRLSHLEMLTLDLSSSLFFPEASDSMPALGSLGLGTLAACPKLVSLSLDLTGNGLGPRGARDVGLGLARLLRLKRLKLDVSMNGVQDVGAWELGTSIGRLTHLTALTLRLHLSSMSAAGLLELVEGLGRLKNLTSLGLDISYNDLGNTAAATMAASRLSSMFKELAKGSLVQVELDVTGTNLGPTQAQQLTATSDQLRHDGTWTKFTGVVLPKNEPATVVPSLWTGPLETQAPADPGEDRTRVPTAQPRAIPQKDGLDLATAQPRIDILSTAAPFDTPAPSFTEVAKPTAQPSIAPSPSTTEMGLAHGHHVEENSSRQAFQDPAVQDDSNRPAHKASPLGTSSRTRFRHRPSNTRTAPTSPAASANIPVSNTTTKVAELAAATGRGRGNSSNSSNSSAAMMAYRLRGNGEEMLVAVGIMVAILGGTLAWCNGACASRSSRRVADRSGDRMSMLGSADDHDDRRESARSTIALSTPARKAEGTAQARRQKEQPKQRTPRKGNDDSTNNFADFANFSENAPVVTGWSNATSSSASNLERCDSGLDGASDCSTLEAMLEAQVASLGDIEQE